MVKGRLRRALRRLLRQRSRRAASQDPALVGLLAGSRFAGLPPEENAMSAEQARRAMAFLLDLAEQMFRVGAETRQIEISVIAVAASCGLHPLELSIVGHTVVLQHAPPGSDPRVMMKVARSTGGRDLSRSVRLHHMVDDMVRHRLDLSGGERTLQEIKRLESRWPLGVRLAGRAVLVSSVTLQANGTYAGVLFAVVVMVVIERVGRTLARGGVPGYYATFVQAALVAGLGILALDFEMLSLRAYASATAANLVLLLPVRSVVSLSQDAITRFGTTAAVRLINVVMEFGALFAGIATVAFVARDVQVVGHAQGVQFPSLPIWLAVLAAAVGATASGVASQAPLRLLPFAALMGTLSITIRVVGRQYMSLPPPLAVLLAAIVLGTVAGRLASRFRLPPGALITPAISASLLPGPDMYRSLSAYTAGAGSSHAGLQLLSAVTVTVAIGAGVVLGNILGAKKELREEQTPQEQ
ncbi:threonine/serine exporter ThrE family protein [Actinomadura sp. 3N508]|uniref:threonine/serine exporter ThrE family protein n=1 Tax=Actinomadura sp. 3N508 TaxID=3375153 RepID=UPI003790B2DD